MKNDLTPGHGITTHLWVEDVTLNKLELSLLAGLSEMSQLAVSEIVQTQNLVTTVKQLVAKVRPDKARSTCNKDLHDL